MNRAIISTTKCTDIAILLLTYVHAASSWFELLECSADLLDAWKILQGPTYYVHNNTGIRYKSFVKCNSLSIWSGYTRCPNAHPRDSKSASYVPLSPAKPGSWIQLLSRPLQSMGRQDLTFLIEHQYTTYCRQPAPGIVLSCLNSMSMNYPLFGDSLPLTLD
jgi:hypothetical protein